jgi:hypothetical protein
VASPKMARSSRGGAAELWPSAVRDLASAYSDGLCVLTGIACTGTKKANTATGCGWRRGHGATTANLFTRACPPFVHSSTGDASTQMELRRSDEGQERDHATTRKQPACYYPSQAIVWGLPPLPPPPPLPSPPLPFPAPIQAHAHGRNRAAAPAAHMRTPTFCIWTSLWVLALMWRAYSPPPPHRVAPSQSAAC